MSATSDWMAPSHEGLYDQANQTVNYLATAGVLARIGITGPILDWYNTGFLPKHARFNTAYENWQNTAERSPAKTAALATAETEFRTVYRQLYTGYMKGNLLVTDEDLVEADMPKRHTGGNKPAPVPVDVITVTTDSSKPGRVKFHFRSRGAAGSAKPYGAHGAELVSAILDEPPADRSQLTNSSFFTRTPGELVFTGEQRAKRLYFAMRWENTRGEKGPWNDIDSIIIP